MAQATGKVIGIEKNGWARVITERTGACSSCQTKQNCHSCLTHAKIEARVLNAAGAKPGDLVTVGIKTETLLKGAAVLYLVPVLGLLMGALAGPAIGIILSLGETASSLLFGFAGFAAGFIIVFWYSKKMSSQQRISPVIEQIIVSTQRAAVSEKTDSDCKTGLRHSGNL